MDAAANPAVRSQLIRYGGGAFLAMVAAILVWREPLLSTGRFLPHTFCYLRDPSLVWTHAITDALIGLAYVAISTTLTYFVHRARRDVPFSWVFLAFGLFIVACGATHFMEVVTLWKAAYWLSGVVKIVTAAASVATAIVLPPLVPKALAMVQASKHLEAERASRAAAEEANRAKDAFLATISHELRTPMTSILGWASMIRTGRLDGDAIENGIRVIEQSARAQAQLIDDLLDVSRIVAGKLALEPAHTDLADVVRSAVSGVAIAADHKEIRLHIVLPPAPVELFADPARLHQVLTNLLANAVKFTPRRGTVRIELRGEGREAVVSVTDDGIGIDPAFLPRVFDRFTQADASSTRVHGGLGLGLAIARHLVELHGGAISAMSDGEGRGSTFTVRLPLSPAIVEPDHATPLAGDEHVDLHGARLLVVEDEPLARDTMRMVLQQYGAEVRAAESVHEAMNLIAEQEPDVIVTDIAMPGEDGFGLLHRLRIRGTSTPVIALSALARADERHRILMAGFDECLQKPVQPARLAAAVARNLTEN